MAPRSDCVQLGCSVDVVKILLDCGREVQIAKQRVCSSRCWSIIPCFRGIANCCVNLRELGRDRVSSFKLPGSG